MGNRLPQAFDKITTLRFHLSFLVALLPVVVAATVAHGWPVVVLVVLSVGTTTAADELLRWLRHDRVARDWSAPLWGLLLALLLPANAGFFLPVVGGLFAILVVKGLLGGGTTPWLNPVLAAWAFLQAGWPKEFPPLATTVAASRSAFDQQGVDWVNTNLFSWLSIQLPPGYLDLLVGLSRPDSALLVESGTLLLLAATVYLLAKGYFPWQVPLVFFVSFAVPLALTGGNVVFQLFTGGLLLNLFFLATDPSGRPLGTLGLVVFAAGAGLVSFLVRTWGIGIDAVGYAVLLMNLFVPWMDRAWKRKTLTDLRVA